MGKTVLKLLWLAGAFGFVLLVGLTLGAMMFMSWGGSVYEAIAWIGVTFLVGLSLWASAGRVFPDRWP